MTTQTTTATILEIIAAMPAAMLMTDAELSSAVTALGAYVQQDVAMQDHAGLAWGQLDICNAEVARRERVESDRLWMVQEEGDIDAIIAEIARAAQLPVDAVVSVLTYDWTDGADAMNEYLTTEPIANIASWVREMVAIDEELVND